MHLFGNDFFPGVSGVAAPLLVLLLGDGVRLVGLLLVNCALYPLTLNVLGVLAMKHLLITQHGQAFAPATINKLLYFDLVVGLVVVDLLRFGSRHQRMLIERVAGRVDRVIDCVFLRLLNYFGALLFNRKAFKRFAEMG